MWKSIIVPANQSVSVVASLRSLSPEGVHTVVVSEDETVPAFASKYADETVVVPSPHEDVIAYKDALVSLSMRPDVEAILPIREEDAYVLSRYVEDFKPHVEIGWPSFDAVRVAQDGYRLATVAEDIGLRVPKTELLTDVTDWDRELIVKPRYGILTHDYVDHLEATECEGRQRPEYIPRGVSPDVDRLIEDMLGHVPVVQECHWGEEYSFRALYDHGEPVKTSLRRQLRGKTYAGGMSVFREMTHDPAVEELAESLLTHLEWNGLASVQFIKERETGEFYLLEINPRVWASVNLDIRAGATYPYDYWLTNQGRKDEIRPGYEEGVATHLLVGELQYLRSVLVDDFPNVDKPSMREAFVDVASSVYQHPHFDYISFDDPKPFARGVLNTLFSAS
ncbi:MULTISPECIES: carboxylate--amine ligase [Haloferax]|uniref:Carbamoyl phosphate synthase-like protein n=2 Tax=Haloferax TaxID=2251 RepID=A0A0D6JVU7_9EURY|nr:MULTISPECIES: ATP-grasp domain-containing protein [Haloferax]CQR52680.1 carbamoyl phosphate synthase-like protein [Haloferax massiliensis]